VLLPRIRSNLDATRSPMPDRPGLLIRDPLQYSDAVLIIPPVLEECLQLFDGTHTDLDLREYLVQLTGDLQVGEIQQHLVDTLSRAGFLEDEEYRRMLSERQRAFAEASARAAAHSPGAYPAEPGALRVTLERYMNGAASGADAVIGVAAPHVSPEGGWESYRDAYAALPREAGEKTFVILGTSHYGQPERFGLTRKRFSTPYGEAEPDLPLIDRLADRAAPAVLMEDYCHAVEHSIEFQVVFLQHLYGPRIRILPILCGCFASSIYRGGMPEDDDAVARFLGELGELAAAEQDRLVWILGVDMAHMGRRYGDALSAAADRGVMAEVAAQDRRRIDCINAGDAGGFWDLVQDQHDPLKWCGSSPFYTFLKAVPGVRGSLERYQQWNIDAASVVSFAGIAFRRV
jgi:AmmeMemoRadiSam system protein B